MLLCVKLDIYSVFFLIDTFNYISINKGESKFRYLHTNIYVYGFW